jgi:purine-cytosine permease-like protein
VKGKDIVAIKAKTATTRAKLSGCYIMFISVFLWFFFGYSLLLTITSLSVLPLSTSPLPSFSLVFHPCPQPHEPALEAQRLDAANLCRAVTFKR